MFEGKESFLGRQQWYKESWVFTAECIAEKIKIAVSALNFCDGSVGKKIAFTGPGTVRLNVKLVVALVNDVVLVPSRASHIDRELGLEVDVLQSHFFLLSKA